MATAGVRTAGKAEARDDDTEPIEQRQRILNAALELMAEGGVHAMSMRSLANACGLNVATLYHYFPSKGALLEHVIHEQQYGRLLEELPPVETDQPLQPRLAALLEWIWMRMAEHDDMWKLLLGESLRGDAQAMTSAAELSATFESALETWLRELFADLPGDAVVTARVLRGLIYGFFIEMMPLPATDRTRYLAKRAQEIASIVVR